MYIRETVLRFASLMEPQIAKGNLDELDFIAGKNGSADDDDSIGWISEMALKAVLIGLLSLLADGEETASVSCFISRLPSLTDICAAHPHRTERAKGCRSQP